MVDSKFGPQGQGHEQDNESQETMESLMQSENAGLEFPNAGEIREGVIASISPSQILVSIGAKSEGVITGREIESIPTSEREALKVGQTIPVFVKNPEDDNGNVVLSYTRARESLGWEVVEKLQESNEPLDGIIDGYNKGGLIVVVNGLRGFVPSSQLSSARRATLQGEGGGKTGETIQVRIIEIDRARRRLILSERAVNSESKSSVKERILDEIKEGQTYSGRVTSIADFGAFVNINGADGLVHLSEISWERIANPSEVLQVGQEVKVKVINVDREKKRIGLSIRALQGDPWSDKAASFKVGQLVEGKITRLTKFGAFAKLAGDIEGLIYISELSENRINHPKEVVKEGDTLTLRVIKIDEEQKRIGLSLRKVDSGAFADLDMKALAAEMNPDSDK